MTLSIFWKPEEIIFRQFNIYKSESFCLGMFRVRIILETDSSQWRLISARCTIREECCLVKATGNESHVTHYLPSYIDQCL